VPETLLPDFHLFAGSEYLKASASISESKRKFVFWGGQPSSFLGLSVNQNRVFKVGGFADFDWCTFGAVGSPHSLKVRGNLRMPLFSLSALYGTKRSKQNVAVAGRTKFTGGGFDWKLESPGLMTIAFLAEAKQIEITIKALLKFNGDALFETLRYGIEVNLLGSD
jgi:hypothetical protein